MKIKIASDFTTAPGPRKVSEGKFSGEQFRKEFLLPKVREASDKKCHLIIDLDGTSGYGTSFLEESFGGLIREDNLRLATLNALLLFVSQEEPDLLQEIREYMEDAEKEKEGKA
jgi:hypothetical protein